MEKLDININYDHPPGVDVIQFNKMLFLYNALENGWSVKKKENVYVFSKNHEGKKEIFLDDYLKTFIKKNFQKK
tara:strand:- start:128 stop:349 length:222 start_codon:yes stop_codon:yes gene_type:complete